MPKPHVAKTYINDIHLFRSSDDKVTADCVASFMDDSGVLIESRHITLTEGEGLNAGLARKFAKALHKQVASESLKLMAHLDMSSIAAELADPCCP